MKNGNVARGDLLIFLAMIIFGTYSLFIRLHPEIPPLNFLFSCQVVGALCFASAASFRPSKEVAWLLVALAFMATMNDLTYFYAFTYTTVAKAAIAHQMVSVFLLIIAPLFLGERTKRSEWIALVVSLLGVIILFSARSEGGVGNDAAGITLGLVSALFYALIIVLYRKLGRRGVNLSTINFWRYTLSTLGLLLFVRFESVSVGAIRPLLTFGFLFAVIASGIHNFGLMRTRALHSSIIGKTEPIWAALYAFLLLGEKPVAETLVGGTLVLGASVWLATEREGGLA